MKNILLQAKMNYKNNFRGRGVGERGKKDWAVLLKNGDQGSQVLITVLKDQLNPKDRDLETVSVDALLLKPLLKKQCIQERSLVPLCMLV